MVVWGAVVWGAVVWDKVAWRWNAGLLIEETGVRVHALQGRTHATYAKEWSNEFSRLQHI